MAANLLLENLNATLLAAQNKRSELVMKYDPSYPLVKETDEEIAHTKAAIADAESAKYVNATTDRDPTYELLREDLAKTQADLATQRANAAAISGTIKGMRTQMVSELAQQDPARVADQAVPVGSDLQGMIPGHILHREERSSSRRSCKGCGDLQSPRPRALFAR